VRIVSGKYKGRHIPVRKNFPSRPTTDFAKENLFNVLNNTFDFEELKVLDLFSGTGSISYEFASRGAIVTLIENDYRSYEFIRKTILDLEMKNVTPFKADVFRALRKIPQQFDIIFADPPYTLKNIEEIPPLIFENQLLTEEGWFILEHSDKNDFRAFRYFKELRKYGSVHFSIFCLSGRK
jgi:16S rRNA (guanine(966)-N(2))-methyltransferase RsmD